MCCSALGRDARPSRRGGRAPRGTASGGASRPARFVSLLFLIAMFVPATGHAGEAGIDVPMGRAGAAARPAEPVAEPGGLLAATERVRGEVEVLRREFGTHDFPARVEPHRDRAPVHVYVKSLEVMSKVAALQRRFGVVEGYVRDMPVAEVSSDEAQGAVQDILDGIEAIKTQMVISTAADVAMAPGRRGLSEAYANLADASVMLDGLVGRELAPQDVFRNVMAVIEDLNLIATRLQVRLDVEVPEAGERDLVATAQQAMRAAYKAVALQTRLGMQASAVPTLTMVRVSPTEAYDLIGILRAELARIKGHLGINVPPLGSGGTGAAVESADLFAHMLLVVRGLDQLTAGAETQG